MKIKIQAGPYLLNVGEWEPFRYENHGESWCLFFGIGSLGRWQGLRGFKLGRVGR